MCLATERLFLHAAVKKWRQTKRRTRTAPRPAPRQREKMDFNGESFLRDLLDS